MSVDLISLVKRFQLKIDGDVESVQPEGQTGTLWFLFITPLCNVQEKILFDML